jgi:hypothetical protein
MMWTCRQAYVDLRRSLTDRNTVQAPHIVLVLEYALLVFDTLLATVITGTKT